MDLRKKLKAAKEIQSTVLDLEKRPENYKCKAKAQSELIASLREQVKQLTVHDGDLSGAFVKSERVEALETLVRGFSLLYRQQLRE